MSTGHKKWNTGDLVEATAFNSYVQNQVVGVYDDSSARDAAFGGTGEPTLAEGMVCFLKDTNELQIYSGSAWVSLLDIDTFSQDSGNYTITDAQLSIKKDSGSAQFQLLSAHDTESSTGIIEFMKQDGSIASPAAVDDNATLGRMDFYGYDGNSYALGARIRVLVDGTPADGDMPSEMLFQVTPDGGSETPVTALTLKPSGEARFTADKDITTFAPNATSSPTGILSLYNTDGTVDDFTCLDFIGNGTDAAARIGMKYTGSGSELHFGTSNSYVNGITNSALIIEPTGIVGIGGVTNPGTDAVLIVRHGSSNAGISVDLASASSSIALVKGYSNVVSTDTLQFVIRSNGDFESRTNSYGAISDERAKTNIVDANSHTEDLKKLRVVNYQFSHQWDEEEEEFVELEELGERHIGLIAQEVEQHFPKLVKDNDGPKSVKYSLLVPMLLQTIQELLRRVEALEAS